MVFIQTSDTLTTQSFEPLSLELPSASQPKSNQGNRDLEATELSNRSAEDRSTEHRTNISDIKLPPLPITRPLLMVGHGTRNPKGRQDLLDF
ncbi:MAG: hypothetical protein AAGL08_20255, partial [Cyanobacteria bacterium J06573_11]